MGLLYLWSLQFASPRKSKCHHHKDQERDLWERDPVEEVAGCYAHVQIEPRIVRNVRGDNGKRHNEANTRLQKQENCSEWVQKGERRPEDPAE
jgi:hypothetical protein